MVKQLTCNQWIPSSTLGGSSSGSTHFFQLKSGVGFGHFSKKEKMTLYGYVGNLGNPPACHAGDSEFEPRHSRQS